MNYYTELTVPAGTPESAKVEATLVLNAGVLRRLSVMFPPGPRKEVYIQVFHWSQQLLPATPDEGLAWDDFTGDYPMAYPIDGQPMELVVRGWSPNATFKHTITVIASVDEAAQAAQAPTSSSLLDTLANLFRG